MSRNLKILELGAGTGLVGLAAAQLGAARVQITDLPYALANIQSNVDRNAAGSSTVEVRALDWFDPPRMWI